MYIGPFPLKEGFITSKVLPNRIGNYLLCRGASNYVKYVGRSDSDLANRLIQHISENYSWFYYSYANSVADAYNQECSDYHHYGQQLDNKIHPGKPETLNIYCPICKK